MERLEHLSGISAEEAKERLVESLKEEAKTQAASYINDIMDDAKMAGDGRCADFAESIHEVLKNAKHVHHRKAAVHLRMCMATPHGTMSRASSLSSIRLRKNRPLPLR